MRLNVLGVIFDVVFDNTISSVDQTRIKSAWSRCEVGSPAANSWDEVAPSPRRYVIWLAVASSREVIDALERECDARTRQTGVEHRLLHAPRLAHLEQRLTSKLTLWAIDARQHDLLMLHAVGLADGRGKIGIFSAASGTGKTTMARTLGAELGYVTDETVAVLPSGLVLPYPKPLSVVVESGAPKRQVGPDDLRLKVPAYGALKPAVLFLLARDPDRVRPPEIEAVTALDGVFELIGQVSFLGNAPGGIGGLLALIEQCGGVYRLHYRDISDAAQLVRQAMARSQSQRINWRNAQISAARAFEAGQHGRGREELVIAGSAVADAVWIEGGLVVSAAGRLMKLEGLGEEIWSALERNGAMSRDDLYQSLIDCSDIGTEVNTHDLFEQAMTTLMEAEVIEYSAQDAGEF
ncbi:hypothetical protein F8O07_03835 [Pseudoclavibacter sp. CFCC 13796]|uniref:hypothetical protein n=1 Tax=Pseudoclavibacter sp. CFCC 13796 TaxID=2615179 RepID=UPI001301501C|nr:hypothetical protein [Pseudoclavibacter sp. CFCC 13796]KAB1661096.1 hypothetical protein F8O07_03835 [Pseudoclavibacter sp. CFCC 13796]